MRFEAVAVLLASFVAAVFTPAPSARATQAPAMALTFDDLPFMAAGGSYFPEASRATAELLSVLARHQAPAVGFVNEWQLEVAGERKARVALLQQWIDAGMTLGNHTHSHRRGTRLSASTDPPGSGAG